MAFGRDDVCEHGSLERKCDICYRDKRIAELEAALAKIVEELAPGDASVHRIEDLGWINPIANIAIEALRKAEPK